MEITLRDGGKSFNRKWLFRNLNCTFKTGESWAFLGANGSGKSTLCLLLAGQVWPTEGEIKWKENGDFIEANKAFSYVSLTAPALELPEEFHLEEIISMHHRAKPMQESDPLNALIDLCEFSKHVLDKPLLNFSSGMKQRVKLAIAAMSDTPLLILDEPLTNMDKAGTDIYKKIIEKYAKNRLLIIASNREDEYQFCKKSLQILPGGIVTLNDKPGNAS